MWSGQSLGYADELFCAIIAPQSASAQQIWGGEADMRTRFNRFSGAAAGVVVLAIFALTAIYTTGQATRTPRAADGKPNLNGIWQVTNTANWDLLPHTIRPAVAQPGVYANHPVLAAPVLALGAAGLVPPGPGVVEGDRDSLQTRGGSTKARERRALAGSRSGSQVLHAGDTARDVHAVSISDYAEHEQDPDGVRICECESHDLPGCGAGAAG